MSLNSPYPFPTRAQYSTLHAINHVEQYKGISYIHRPTIDKIKQGMMVRAWSSKQGNSRTTFGTIVSGVERDSVFVRDNIGGRLDCITEVPFTDIQQVWSIGTEEEALRLVNAFNCAIFKTISKE